MENILLPSKMSFSEGEKENESILTIEPLHHGYGTTIGNALRRVLLSSLEGAAVTAVKIKGAQHEFSAVEGIKEDVLEIILNLKQLRMKVHSDEPVVLKLSQSGEKVVTAGDIEKNADVEVVNSDLVIATLTGKDSNLEMEITVGRGRGFYPTEERGEASGDIGLMAVDAMYSPIVSVAIHVENTRVGEITNYDKLVMTILTDGTISAEDAVKDATTVLLNHFNWIDSQLDNASLTEKLEAAREEGEIENPEEEAEASPTEEEAEVDAEEAEENSEE